MTATLIQDPYPMFHDLAGDPLASGYVYIGVAGSNPETTPNAVFYDSAMTIGAPQPLRTIAGRISNAGTPADVYIDGDYSITVRDSRNRLVYSSLSENAGLIGAVSFDTYVAFEADTSLSYAEGAGRRVVTEGDYVTVGGVLCIVAASTSTDFDIESNSSPTVKLYDLSKRTATTATHYANTTPDGTIFAMSGYWYEVDSSVTGGFSATNDLGVNGIKPHGEIWAAHFGATGDRTTDVTTNLQSAIDYAGTLTTYSTPVAQAELNTLNAAPVNLMAGGYLVSSTLSVNTAGVSIRGEDRTSTAIISNFDGKLFDIRHPDEFNSGSIHNIGISDLTLQGKFTDPTGNSVAIDVGIVKHSYFSRLRIGGFYNDIVLTGTLSPVFITDVNFFSGNSVSTSTGAGGGSFITARAAMVASDSPNRAYALEDPDNPGIYYCHTVMVYVSDCELRNGADAKQYAWNIQAVDGFYVDNCHAINVNNTFVRINQSSSVVPVTNVKFDGVFFDGESAATEKCVHIASPAFAETTVVSPIKLDFNNCKFNGAGSTGETGTRGVHCESPFVDRLSINGGYFDKIKGTYFIQATAGRHMLSIQNVEFQTSNTNDPSAVILLGGATADVFFDKVVIGGCKFYSEDASAAGSNIRITNHVNNVGIAGNFYVPHTGGSGDGLIYDTKTSGTVVGDAATKANTSI